MRDERGESVGVSGVPTPLAALFICSCFLCFVKTRRRQFWDVPLLYVLYTFILARCSLSALEPFFDLFSAPTPRLVARLAPSDSPQSRGPCPRAGPPSPRLYAQR